MTRSRNLDAKLYMCFLREVFKMSSSLFLYLYKEIYTRKRCIIEKVDYNYDTKEICEI